MSNVPDSASANAPAWVDRVQQATDKVNADSYARETTFPSTCNFTGTSQDDKGIRNILQIGYEIQPTMSTDEAYQLMVDSALLNRLVTSHSLAPLSIFVAMRAYLSRYGFRAMLLDEDPVIYTINILGPGSSRLRHAAKFVTAATGIHTTVGGNSLLCYDPDDPNGLAQQTAADQAASSNAEKVRPPQTMLTISNQTTAAAEPDEAAPADSRHPIQSDQRRDGNSTALNAVNRDIQLPTSTFHGVTEKIDPSSWRKIAVSFAQRFTIAESKYTVLLTSDISKPFEAFRQCALDNGISPDHCPRFAHHMFDLDAAALYTENSKKANTLNELEEMMTNRFTTLAYRSIITRELRNMSIKTVMREKKMTPAEALAHLHSYICHTIRKGEPSTKDDREKAECLRKEVISETWEKQASARFVNTPAMTLANLHLELLSDLVSHNEHEAAKLNVLQSVSASSTHYGDKDADGDAVEEQDQEDDIFFGERFGGDWRRSRGRHRGRARGGKGGGGAGRSREDRRRLKGTMEPRKCWRCQKVGDDT
jgi:hypothetical protein